MTLPQQSRYLHVIALFLPLVYTYLSHPAASDENWLIWINASGLDGNSHIHPAVVHVPPTAMSQVNGFRQH